LSYSHHPQQLANEMLRVCRPGGLIAVGVEYSSMDDSAFDRLIGYNLATPGMKRINTVQQIEQLFEPNLADRYFTHDAPLRLSHTPQGMCDRPSGVATIFSIRKAA
jgi:ubiquinone/menaquinone biosynthesis C-methylase UbiE